VRRRGRGLPFGGSVPRDWSGARSLAARWSTAYGFVACSLVACSLVACSPRERTWQRANVSYVVRHDDRSVDESIVDELVSHRDIVSRYLGLDPSSQPLRYHKFRDTEDFARRSHCSAVTSGCFFHEHGVESSKPLDAHELIHAYTADLGDKPKLVEEGLAQALSCGDEPVIGVELSLEVAWSAASWQSTRLRDIDKLYRAGAMFVAHTIRRYGPLRFMAFYRTLGAGDETAEVTEKFLAEFGEPLEKVWGTALTSPSIERACVYPIQCAQPDVGHSTPPAGPQRPSHVRTFEGGPGRLLHVTAKPGEPSSRLRLGACEGTGLPSETLPRSPRGELLATDVYLALPPGKYWLAGQPWDTAYQSVSSVVAAERVMGIEQQCENLQPLQLASTGETLVTLPSPSEPVGELRPASERSTGATSLISKLPPGVGADSRLIVECSKAVRVEVCESCAYTGCQTACETGRPKSLSKVPHQATVRVLKFNDEGGWVRFGR
jgi:hypothetical protein